MDPVARRRAIARTVADDLASAQEVEAILLVGSTATGRADEHSDVDLQVVGDVEPGARTEDGIHVEWTAWSIGKIEERLRVWRDDPALYTYRTARILYDEVDIDEVLARYREFPEPVRRAKLFSGWFYGTGEAFDARKADRRGDRRGSLRAAVSAVEQLVALEHILAGGFPPYRSWLLVDPPVSAGRLDDIIGGDTDALDAFVSATGEHLWGELPDERIDRPYAFRPVFPPLCTPMGSGEYPA